MKPILNFTACILFTGIVTFTSCRKSPTAAPATPVKHAPIANAGPDQTFNSPPNSIALDGTASTDPDGSNLIYQWSRVSGPVSIGILNNGTSVTEIKNIVPGLQVEKGIYEFQLKVTNANGLSSTGKVSITVIGPPKANAGQDQTITLPTNSVTLDGSGSVNLYFPVVAFSWTQVSGPGQSRILYPNSFTTSVTDLVQGTYNFRLQVTDNLGAVADDTVQVNVLPDPLVGQEFVFPGLTWGAGDFFGNGNNDVYVFTPDRPDLFDISRPMEISIRFDTSAAWVNVPRMASPLPVNNGFLYDIYSPAIYVFAMPANPLFAGQNVSIKVKFL